MKKKAPLFLLPACLLLFCATAVFLLFQVKSRHYIRAAEAVSASAAQPETEINPFSSLSVPSCITRIGEDYFIVDTYHDQIICSDSLTRPLTEWRVVTDQITRGHTIAGDGTVYLADDTENNRVLVLEKKDGKFLLTQEFAAIGTRPHYVVYDEKTERFYAYSSMTGELYVFRRLKDSSQVVLEDIRSIEKLNGVYVRSFTIMGDEIYFVPGNSTIIRAKLKDLSILEGVLARGDRRTAKVVLEAYRNGAIFDSWSEYFRPEAWEKAFRDTGIDKDFYTVRERSVDELLPWDFINAGVTKKFLIREWEQAKAETVTPNCRQRCSGCGAKCYGGGVCFEGQD